MRAPIMVGMGWENACRALPLELLERLSAAPPETWLDAKKAIAAFIIPDRKTKLSKG